MWPGIRVLMCWIWFCVENSLFKRKILSRFVKQIFRGWFNCRLIWITALPPYSRLVIYIHTQKTFRETEFDIFGRLVILYIMSYSVFVSWIRFRAGNLLLHGFRVRVSSVEIKFLGSSIHFLGYIWMAVHLFELRAAYKLVHLFEMWTSNSFFVVIYIHPNRDI